MNAEDRLRALMREVDAMPTPDLWPQVERQLRPSRGIWFHRSGAFLVTGAAALVVLSVIALSSGGGKSTGPGGTQAVASGLGGTSDFTALPSTLSSRPPTGSPPVTPGPMSGSSVAPMPSPSTAGALTVATLPPGSTAGDALASGKLGGQVAEGVACFWVSIVGGDRAALVWPYGFSAAADPLAVRGPDGQILAEPGDMVALGGGGPAAGAAIPPDQDPCGVGRLFRVSVVASVNGASVGVGEGSAQLVTRAAGTAMVCPSGYLPALMLVMSHGGLRLRTSDSIDLTPTWPAGFGSRQDSRIAVVDPAGRVVATQGILAMDLRGVLGPTSVDICGLGNHVYP